MPHQAITALETCLRPHVALSNSRLSTLAGLIVAMVSARTVNLSHLACERPGAATTASTYRRLQRFFQHVDLGPDWALPIVVALLGLRGRWRLVLDRTQWRVGAKDVNYLVLAAVTPRLRVPLIWTVIEGPGCSDTAQRIALMRRYLAVFPVLTIRLLLADREFVGADWIEFLHENNVPFAIRLRADLRATTEEGHALTLGAHLGRRRRTRFFRARLAAERAEAPQSGPRALLSFAAKRLPGGEALIVVSTLNGPAALAGYRRRWAIESLFGDANTRGVNLEDTRLTDPRKLDLLMALVTLALAWAARAAAMLLGPRAPKRKAHGHFAKSWFRTGFDHTRRLLRADPAAAVAPWLALLSPTLRCRRVV